ncbi:gamma-mobile-trio protein GmtX [Bradyrhizobium sp. F1.13.3]|uniref:gamma-mobile-trio protein GmtX n=1 Tax=Bradyrhizobium sp. F1.13.3 TaxID=3156351 RepID=UPI0033929795
MTNIAVEKLAEDADRHFESLLVKATTESMRARLRIFHLVCRRLVCKAKVDLSIPLVLRHYKAEATNAQHRLEEQTIRNKRPAGNPYQSLYRRWNEVAVAIKALEAPNRPLVDVGHVREGDLGMIENPILRARMNFIVAENRSLKSQLDTLKQIEKQTPLRIEGAVLAAGGADLVLSEGEIEALREFVDPRRMTAKQMDRTKHDGVKLRDGRVVADPGFVSALEKIVKSYERP